MFGVGEVPISISGNPAGKTLLHTIREAGSVTRQMGKLKAGDTVGIRGPFGTDWPMDAARGMDVVVVAGGIAFAPVRPIIYSVFNDRAKYGKLSVLYGARTPGDLCYEKEAKGWRSQDDTTVMMTVDRAAPGWSGNVGVVTTLIGKAKHENAFDPYNSVAMVCGPEIMMRFTVAELVKRGIPESRIYVSLERNMKCGIGLCGHCQMQSQFICKDGPVFRQDRIRDIVHKREL
jgi:NAD(P)H-flavin reductase